MLTLMLKGLFRRAPNFGRVANDIPDTDNVCAGGSDSEILEIVHDRRSFVDLRQGKTWDLEWTPHSASCVEHAY